MPLLLGQLVYTSFAGSGFSILASTQVPTEIQQAFQRITSQHWDSYNPPRFGYRAVYLNQVTPEQSLFGWLYNDGADDMGRTNVPYFICYYLAQPLHAVQLENIFTCLHKGPLALIDRHSLPTFLENIVVRNFWRYQPARPGVAIPKDIRKRSHIALKQGELLELFIPVNEQEMAIELTAPTYEQQRMEFSIYTDYLVEGMETGAVELIEARIAPQTKAIQSPEKFVGAIKSKDVPLVKPLNEAVGVNEADTRSPIGTMLPQILSTVQIKIGLEKSAAPNSVVAYRNSQLLLAASIAATVLALISGIYGLLHASIVFPRKPDVIPPTPTPYSLIPTPCAFGADVNLAAKA